MTGVDAITAEHVDGQPLSVGTVPRVYAVLHRALAQAMRWDWIWTNPAAAANKPAEEPTELRPPTPAQVNALLAHAAADPAFQLFLVLAATTGARRGELLALRWADIDLARGNISVQRALIGGPSGPVLAPTKTRRSHHVDLDARTLALVRAHYIDTHRATSGPVDRERFVFSADPDGAESWRPNWVSKRFIAIRTAAGVGHVRLHDLRHHDHRDAPQAGPTAHCVGSLGPRSHVDHVERPRTRRPERRPPGRHGHWEPRRGTDATSGRGATPAEHGTTRSAAHPAEEPVPGQAGRRRRCQVELLRLCRFAPACR